MTLLRLRSKACSNSSSWPGATRDRARSRTMRAPYGRLRRTPAAVDAPHLAQRAADLADGGQLAQRLAHRRQDVGVAGRGLLAARPAPSRPRPRRAVSRSSAQPLALVGLDRGVDAQRLVALLGLAAVAVEPDDDPLAAVDARARRRRPSARSRSSGSPARCRRRRRRAPRPAPSARARPARPRRSSPRRRTTRRTGRPSPSRRSRRPAPAGCAARGSPPSRVGSAIASS